MQRYEYFITEDGATTYSRPKGIPSSYDAYSVVEADEGKILRHKKTGMIAKNFVILSSYLDLWEEVEDKPE